MKKKKTIKNILAHTVLTLLAIVWVSPLVWIILTSFRAQKGAYTRSFFPKSYSLDNYIKLFTDTGILNFPRMFTNTLIVAVFSCIISTFFVLSVAYCMSRLKFKMRKAMMNVAMILGLFPAFMAMIAVYYILKAIGLSEGSMIRVALVLVYSASAGIQFYIAKGFFDTIPKTIDEAALIDGATKWQVFTKITIPLSKPIIVYTVLTSFIAKPCAKKYGVDFTLRKDATTQPPHYIVIFKAKDADNMEQAFKEFTAKKLQREERPSIRKDIAASKEKAAARNADRAKEKFKERAQLFRNCK